SCAACDLFDPFAFAAPEKQAVGPGLNQGFPRVQIVGGTPVLVYGFDAATDDADIGAIVGGPPWMGGAAVNGAEVNTSSNDSGPVLLPEGVGYPGLSGTGLLLFESDRSGGVRKLYAAPGIGGDSGPTLLPGIINDGANEDEEIAFAYEANPPRVYWRT